MGLLVQKYGGTSVATPQRIQAVADRVKAAYQSGNRLVVVVSAMGHTTDELIELAHQVSQNPPHREMDMLLTAGERIAMALLSMALADRGIPALSLTGSQSGIITTASHRRARIIRIAGSRVAAALESSQVVIVAGFQGVSEAKEITTLGRGGSDTTAVALAAHFKAEACEIYTDVEGVFSADPRVVPCARLWPEVSYDSMVMLASLGAGVLHPRCVELASQYGVKLFVKNSLSHGRGTAIVESKSLLGMEVSALTGITLDAGKTLIRLEMARASTLSTLWEVSTQAQLSLNAPLFMGPQVYFYIESEQQEEWKTLLNRLAVDGFVKKFEVDSSQIPLSLVGERLTQDGSMLGQVFDSLSRAGITAELGQVSALSITLSVPRTRGEDAVRELHQRFFESQEHT